MNIYEQIDNVLANVSPKELADYMAMNNHIGYGEELSEEIKARIYLAAMNDSPTLFGKELWNE